MTKTGTTEVRRVDMVIVGAGFGGLYAVYRFREMGFDIQAFEAGGDVGGVWYWNRYPGARVDLPSIDYSFSFSPEIEQEWTWSEEFAAQPELLAYMNFVAERLDLRKHYRFNTRIARAVWDEARQIWQVFTEAGETYEARYCVMATGPLSVPRDPDIAGLDRFQGELLRAARWPHTPVGFAGKRVGVIGTGSSGIQIIQEVGPQAGELFVFQRTPSFSMPMRNKKLTPDYVAEVKRHYPGLRAQARNSAVGGLRPQSTRAFFSVTPEQRISLLEDAWKQGGLTILGTFSDLLINAEANEQVAEFLRGKIDTVVRDPIVADKLKPRGYPVFARRPCLDSSYYETYNLPHVHLKDCLDDPIEEITERGVRLRSGEVELDMLILATGYDGLTGAMLAFEVVGRESITVKDTWREGAHTYLGMMMHGFPNLFMTTGPNGPSALANIVRINENDVNWIADAITHVQSEGHGTLEPSVEAQERWMGIVRELAQRSLLTKAKTWYVGANVKGKPQGLTLFTGGFPKYVEHCNSAVSAGYADMVFTPSAQAEAAPVQARGGRGR